MMHLRSSLVSGRPLTQDEIDLARSIFGEEIDYARVRVHNCKWRFFMPHHRPHAPNGHVYFPPGTSSYAIDFSKSELRDRSVFIHELAHVWQHQKGVNVAGRAVLNRNYDYGRIFHGRPFSRLGVEAQAKMIGDYFLLKNGAVLDGRPPIDAYEGLLPFAVAS